MFLWTRNHNLKYSELETLKTFPEFCVKMYFYTKLLPNIYWRADQGTFCLNLKFRKTLPINVMNIATPYIRIGAWYSHSECILISLLTSSNEIERKFGVDKILQVRGNNELGITAVRKRISPKIQP